MIVVVIIVLVAVAAVGAYVALGVGSSKPSSTTSTGTTTSSQVPTSSTQTTTSTTSTPSTTSTTSSESLTTQTTQSTTQQTSQPSTTTSTTSTSPVTTSSTIQSTTSSTSYQTSTTSTTLSCSASSTSYTSTSVSTTSTDIVPLITSFPSMEVAYNGTSSGQSFNSVSSYNTIYTSSTTIKLNITYAASGSNINYLVWIQTNGNVLAADVSGYNLTGASAQSVVTGIFTSFFLLQTDLGTYSGLLSSGYFHSTGTSTVTIGQTTMKVTNYAAASLPETYTDCGITSTLQAFTLQVGTPPGTSTPLLTYLNESGSTTQNGQTTSFDITLKLVALTVA